MTLLQDGARSPAALPGDYINMKVLMLCEFFNEDMEYQENLLAKYYVKNGHDITIVTSTFESVWDYYEDRHDNSVPQRTYRFKGAKVIKLPFRYNIMNRLRAYPRIDKILEEEAPDLIFVHDIMLNLPEAIRYVKRHPKCRMIMDYHADYSNSGKNWLSRRILHGIIRKWFLNRARPHLARIFPVVPASMKFLHQIYGVPHSEMEILPLGADLDLVRETHARGEGKRLRQQIGIPEDAIVIFTGGKLTPKKRTEVLVQAVALLPQYPLHVVVAGDSSAADQDYKQHLLEEAKVANVHLVGWLDKASIYRHMDMADLAVFPASQSILWQQAIAAGLPLIVGDSGDQDISYLNLYDNIIILGSTDINPRAFSRALDGVLSNPERLHKMRAGATLVADQELNWDSLIQRTLRFNTEHAEPTLTGVAHGSRLGGTPTNTGYAV